MIDVNEWIKAWGCFLWGAICIFCGMTAEVAGTLMVYAGHKLMRASELLVGHALSINGDEEVDLIEREDWEA